jgi:hypothetical protein
MSPPAPQFFEHFCHQRFGYLWFCGFNPTRSSTAIRIAIQSELTDHKNILCGVSHRKIHHTVGVTHDPQIPNFVGQLGR